MLFPFVGSGIEQPCQAICSRAERFDLILLVQIATRAGMTQIIQHGFTTARRGDDMVTVKRLGGD
jgi:hypothetical protein